MTTDALALHNTRDDCWHAYHGNVYDLSDYVHPGGDRFISDYCGTDATSAYAKHHSTNLLRSVRKFGVGTLSDGGQNGENIPVAQSTEKGKKKKGSKSSSDD